MCGAAGNRPDETWPWLSAERVQEAFHRDQRNGPGAGSSTCECCPVPIWWWGGSSVVVPPFHCPLWVAIERVPRTRWNLPTG